MKNRELRIIIIYLIIMWVFGFIGGMLNYNELEKKYEELKQDYEILEIQYKRDLEDCYTQFGDYQDRVEAGCYVNGGWICE